MVDRRSIMEIADCQKCGAAHEDFDGLGVLHCANCGYCTHASQTGDRCDLCGFDFSTVAGFDPPL
jgi:hypothetical protein